jgi:hypothetical protein
MKQMNKSIKQKLNKKNAITNQGHTKGNTHTQKNRWITFTYFGHGAQQIAKIFKDTTPV